MKAPHALILLAIALGVVSCSENTEPGTPLRWNEAESFAHAMAQDFHCAVVTSQSPDNVGRTFPLTTPETETPTLGTFQEMIDRSRHLDRYSALGPATTIANEVCADSNYFSCRLIPNHPKIWQQCAESFLARAKKYPQDYAEFDPDHMYLNRLIEMGGLIRQSLAAFGSATTYGEIADKIEAGPLTHLLPDDFGLAPKHTEHSFLGELLLRHARLIMTVPEVLEEQIAHQTKDSCGGCNPWNLDTPIRPIFKEIPLCDQEFKFKAMATEAHVGGATWAGSKIKLSDFQRFALGKYLPSIFSVANHFNLTTFRGCIEAVDFRDPLTPPIDPKYKELHKKFPKANEIQGKEAFVRIRVTLRFTSNKRADTGEVSVLHLTTPYWVFHEQPAAGQHYQIKESQTSRTVLLPAYMKDKVFNLLMDHLARGEGVEDKTNQEHLKKELDFMHARAKPSLDLLKNTTGITLKNRIGLHEAPGANKLATRFEGYRQAVLKGVNFASGDAISSPEVETFLRYFSREIPTGEEFLQKLAQVAESIAKKPISYAEHWHLSMQFTFSPEWNELKQTPRFGQQSALDQTLQDLKSQRN